MEPTGNTRKAGRLAVLLIAAAGIVSAQSQQGWRLKLEDRLGLYGHRNWIVIADSAYPLQSGPGIETIVSNESQIETIRHVLFAVSKQTHVRPVVFLDRELRFVSEADAPGIMAYRQLLDGQLDKYPNGLIASSLPHEDIIARLDEAARTFNVLVIKTSFTLPYTSVFIQLDAAYWSDEAEKRLRQSIPPR